MRQTRIMVFGTFDFLHKGHLNFFKQARSLAKKPFLIVSIARDINVKKIKGKKPFNNEVKRRQFVLKSKLANRVVLGGLKKYLPHILKEKPNLIALGYDQKAYIKVLRADIKKYNLNINLTRLKAFKPKLYKSSILKNNLSVV